MLKTSKNHSWPILATFWQHLRAAQPEVPAAGLTQGTHPALGNPRTWIVSGRYWWPLARA